MKRVWRNLSRSKPPVNEEVELQHMIVGIGAPEREGWFSTGRMRESGTYSILQNKSGTVDYRPPTHWRAIKTD